MKKILILVAISIMCSQLKAQQITDFEMLYQLSLVHHPDSKLSEIERQKLLSQLNEIGAYNPVLVQYEAGQINGTPFDHKISATQDLSYLQLQKEKKSNVQSQIEAITKRNEFSLLKMRNELEKKYQHYLLQKSIMNEWEHLEKTFEIVVSKMKLQYEVGEIDRVLFTLVRNELLSITTQKELQKIAIFQSENEIKSFALLPNSVVFPAEILKQKITQDSNAKIQSISYNNWLDSEKNVLDSEINMYQKSAKKPSFNAGLFSQSLNKELLYAGILVGVSIPIDTRVSKAKIEQLDWQKNALSLQKEQWEMQRNYQSEVYLQQLQVLQSLIKTYEEQFIAENATQLDRIQLQLVLGEIDFVRFSQLQRSIQDMKISYWQLIEKHNIAVIEYQFYN